MPEVLDISEGLEIYEILEISEIIEIFAKPAKPTNWV